MFAQAYRNLCVFVPRCPSQGFLITEAVRKALGTNKKTVHRTITKLHGF
jgi:hypothetical protein